MSELQFPSTENLAHGDNGDVILGCSVQLNRILLELKAWSREHTKAPKFTALFLNAYTLFEGNHHPNTPLKDIIAAFQRDIDFLGLYLDTYFSHYTLKGYVPLVLYVPNYGTLPKELLRVPNERTQDLNTKFRSFVSSKLPPTPKMTSRGQNVRLFVVPCGRSKYPHLELADWFSDLTIKDQELGYRKGDPIFITTHCVIDLHIYRRIQNVSLLERYWGTIKPPIDFGSKLTKEVKIPFNIATHRAFGDPVHIAPLVQRKSKKELLEVALSHKWILKTYTTIVQDISKVTGKSVAELNKYHF